jgi:hypothetical protein
VPPNIHLPEVPVHHGLPGSHRISKPLVLRASSSNFVTVRRRSTPNQRRLAVRRCQWQVADTVTLLQGAGESTLARLFFVVVDTRSTLQAMVGSRVGEGKGSGNRTVAIVTLSSLFRVRWCTGEGGVKTRARAKWVRRRALSLVCEHKQERITHSESHCVCM